ncbi:Tudor domain-containing protein 3 [Geodia barretti]|uniref:Tudor domain-containing protein 3 n=1 Tax=Geodia barretti TaxID=519541 RepID=A0AA35SXZ7_GEOBA|nr:Tudor domain-containing protein 3 [Geodia barretti]
MAKSETLRKELEKLGWHLTAEGLARCEALCEQKNFEPTAKNVEKVALDLDLRSIGEQALSDDVARNTKHEVEGPLVLQVQRVRNVALPSTRQFSSSASRRLLRVQLTDGRVSLGGVEMEGAIPGLSTQSPPGTKVLLLQKVEAQKGFLLLGKNSLEVLGGRVEHLVQKWSLTKIMPDELGRSAGGSNDAPQFLPFGKSAGVKTAKGQDQLKHHENKRSSVSTREAVVSSMTREDEREKMEMPLSEEITFRKTPQNREFNQSRSGRGQYGRPATEGARNYRGDTGEGSDGRGRGRGRRGRREREDCYDQGKRSESSMLSDWLEQKLTVSSNYGSQQPDMSRGGEEDYWEEVWAYQESLAIAGCREAGKEKQTTGHPEEGARGP